MYYLHILTEVAEENNCHFGMFTLSNLALLLLLVLFLESEKILERQINEIPVTNHT